MKQLKVMNSVRFEFEFPPYLIPMMGDPCVCKVHGFAPGLSYMGGGGGAMLLYSSRQTAVPTHIYCIGEIQGIAFWWFPGLFYLFTPAVKQLFWPFVKKMDNSKARHFDKRLFPVSWAIVGAFPKSGNKVSIFLVQDRCKKQSLMPISNPLIICKNSRHKEHAPKTFIYIW